MFLMSVLECLQFLGPELVIWPRVRFVARPGVHHSERIKILQYRMSFASWYSSVGAATHVLQLRVIVFSSRALLLSSSEVLQGLRHRGIMLRCNVRLRRCHRAHAGPKVSGGLRPQACPGSGRTATFNVTQQIH